MLIKKAFNSSKWPSLRQIAIISIVFGALGFYQNCSNVNFGQGYESTSAQSASVSTPVILPNLDLALVDAEVTTHKNIAVEFEMQPGGGNLGFGQAPGVNSISVTEGSFEIIDLGKRRLRYTPLKNYVGEFYVDAFATDNSGQSVKARIHVRVGNKISHLEPALAVRGVSCMACHAKVASNIITDFGYKGDGKGNDYFFSNPSRSKSSMYGDHGQYLPTMELLNNAKVLIPKNAMFSEALGAGLGSDNLLNYLKGQFSQSIHPGTKAAEIIEKDTLIINLPTASRLKEVFGSSPGAYKYEPDTHLSPPLTGLDYDPNKRVFSIGTLICDGDLFLDGTVIFDNGVIYSNNGCRIYATESIFVQNGIQSLPTNNSENHNIQLFSSRSIWLGVGEIVKNGNYCEVGRWYQNQNKTNSFTNRLAHLINYLGYTRSYLNPTELADLVSNDALRVGQMWDATCEDRGGRAKSLNRVLLAAPWVNSRYNGSVSGSVIAETGLMSLNAFIFQYDPVFKSVLMLPKFNESEILKVQ